ncbi:MAG: type I DNA topoisomerase [Christensenellaceae bacterium]|nr:type I DNA topoisomerase [Christensenellaceae bacterium]
MKLVIVESPAKAKTIQKYLGEGFNVIASGGHIYDLPKKELGIDVKNSFRPKYIADPAKEELLKRLKKYTKQSEQVYLATDPDREGEAISWHLASNLNIDFGGRVEFNEISEKAVKRAIANPRQINMNLVDAQQARRVLDRLVGYKISPILSTKIRNGLSAGRVQSAALRMIVEREREILAFIPEEYWHIFAHLKKLVGSETLKALLADKCGTKLKVTNKETSDAVLADLENAEWIVDKVKRGESKSRPAPPFMTSTLQQDGSQKLGLTAPQVMNIAQQLYEGVDLGNQGHVALVTYIRTDSVRVSQDMQISTLDYIKRTYGAEYAPSKPNVYSTKNQNSQDAHEAIRPISLEITPESVRAKLQRNHYKLYKLIYDRFVASQMTDAIYNTLNVRIQANTVAGDNYGFKVSGKAVAFKGYTIAYESANLTEPQDTDANETEGYLPNLVEGEKLELIKITADQKFTKPPSRYTDATLIKAMEENGIGRPSTYATVVSILTNRAYIIKEQKFMIPTPLGISVTEFLERFFLSIVDTRFTADMETKLDTVEQGVKWQDIISDFYPLLLKHIFDAIGAEKAPPEVSDVICDKCGANMVIKHSKFGKFLGCPNYPECKNTKPIIDVVAKCPVCGGDISRRKSKNGKEFFGCNNYPTCTFISWEIPAPILCPKCGSGMVIRKKNKLDNYVCTDRKCKHTIAILEPSAEPEELTETPKVESNLDIHLEHAHNSILGANEG